MNEPTNPSEPTDIQTLHERVRRKVSKADVQNICTIIDRFEAELPNYFERSSLVLRFMEVCSVVPMDLNAMATWDRMSDIAHDIGGMMNRWDSEKLQFRDCFSPRFAKVQ